MPSAAGYPGGVGYFAAAFETMDENGRVTRGAVAGTASLSSRISSGRFTLRTAAHNLIQWREALGEATAVAATEACFLLECDGAAYRFKFDLLGFRAHPGYRSRHDFLTGSDWAAVAVEVDKTDPSFSEEDFAKIDVPDVEFLSTADLADLEAALLRVYGYPLQVFDAATGHLEENPRRLYSDEGSMGAIELHGNGARATASYGFEDIVTSRGQSGGAIQAKNATGSGWRTIGMHTGNQDDRNLGSLLTREL